MLTHLKAETTLTLRILLRQPGFWIPTVLFPAMLYAFFGAQSAGTAWAANGMASFTLYAVLGVGFFQFGVSIAQDRESPFARWQESLPGHALAPWIARILASLLFTGLAVALVVALALWMSGVRLDAGAWGRLALVCLLASATATLMGIALGNLASARAAVPLANLVYLPLAYLGGLWLPPFLMPSAIQTISEWTPTRAMGELGWAAVEGRAFPTGYLALLGAWSAAALLLALAARAGLLRRA